MAYCPPVRRTFSDERGPGAFHSLGVLPRRAHPRPPVFHIHHGDDDPSAHDDHPPVLFPTTRPDSPPSPGSSSSSSSRPPSPRPQLSRGASAPILLSNGKPLKSSLKSSSSSPAMLIPSKAQNMHLRARSEPSTPKNVHFPEKDYGLATVCVYSRTARPAALGSPVGDETETEGEDTPPTHFPFPPASSTFNYEIDPTNSSPIPPKPSSPANVLVESLSLFPSSFSSPRPTTRPLLIGFVLVRNLAFEKHVAIRFTLDEWETISEVGAHYVDSLSVLPSQFTSSSPSPRDAPLQSGRGWDRFTFTIHLEDYAHSLSTRTLWLAARYRVNSAYPEPGSSQYGPGGEWWDNNGGSNYRIGFRPIAPAPSTPPSRPRRETVSVPISSPRTQPPPPATSKEHALGLMIPSVPSRKEDKRLSPLRTGKLNLCNYVPPTVRATSSVSSPVSPPSAGSPQTALPSSAAQRSPTEEDTESPASSTLSTPSVSPTMVPHVIIGGQPATSTYNSNGKEECVITSSRPGNIADWDWSATNMPRIEELPPEQRRDIPSPPGRKTLPDSNSLYVAFVTQWCFAQGHPSHNPYDGGIMA